MYGMNIDLIFRIAAIGILVSVLNAVLKKSDREELAMLTSLAGLIIVLMMVIQEIVKLFDEVKTIFQF
jgi:stage III sporulation protein AC